MSLLIAPIEALTDALLSDPERRVLLSLFSFRGKNTDTVWPSIESIAERANMGDQTRVSKITTSLAAKGWLTKRKKGFTGCNEYKLEVPSRLDVSPNLDSDAKLVSDALSNLDGDAKSNLDSDAKYKEQTIEQTIEEDIPALAEKIKTQKPKGRKTQPETLITEYIQDCKSRDVKTIPAGHGVFEYADDVGIPSEFLALAWRVFRDEMIVKQKKQKDWPATFRNYIESDWIKIWAIDGSGEFYLTTKGKQAEMKYRKAA